MSHQYDVFLSFHQSDHAFVKTIAERLEDEARLKPFYGPWHLIPGGLWQGQLEVALEASACGAVFIGRHGLGPWQGEEVSAMLNGHVGDHHYRLIPLLLPGTNPDNGQTVPLFVRNRNWIDFRRGSGDVEAFRRLVAAIRGKPPGRPPSVLQTLLATLGIGDSLQRQATVNQLSILKNRSVIPALERRWPAEEDYTVRHFIALTIGEIGGPRATATLRRLRARETDPFALLGIDLALQSITTGGSS